MGLIAIKPFMGGSLFTRKTKFPVVGAGDKQEHDLARLTLQCILTNDAITTTVPGLTTVYEVESAVRASYVPRVKMTAAEEDWLARMTARRWAAMPQEYAWMQAG
jgi:hypothetical protein